MEMDGSDVEADMILDCSKDWIEELPADFRKEMSASFQTASRHRQRRLDEGCSLAAASQAWGTKERMFPECAYVVQRTPWHRC